MDNSNKRIIECLDIKDTEEYRYASELIRKLEKQISPDEYRYIPEIVDQNIIKRRYLLRNISRDTYRAISYENLKILTPKIDKIKYN